MLQIDHVYEFFYQSLFKDFAVYSLPGGVPQIKENLTKDDIHVFNYTKTDKKIFFWDQEPVLDSLCRQHLTIFNQTNIDKKSIAFVASEISVDVASLTNQFGLLNLYYFFHGFAALDWYRGFYALNYRKNPIRDYTKDFVSYNRLIDNDRSYRNYFVSKLVEYNLLDTGLVSYNVADNLTTDWSKVIADPYSKLSSHAVNHIQTHLKNITQLTIDSNTVPGYASADIPRSVDALWNIVTETVFYYDKLHLTEKIFKPIVGKQPFMLIAAPGNLAYLRRYGFKTFDGIIDESYDSIQDPDARIDAVVAQLKWYCNLSADDKQQVIERLTPIVEYNFHHFYGEFRHIITQELLDNCKTLFKAIGYDDSTIAYDDIYKVLTR